MKIITNKSMEACTCHITENDSKLLDMDVVPLSAYKYEYGWFVYVDENADYTKPLAIEEGLFNKNPQFSAAFMELMKLAQKNKCKFLQLDCDGMGYPDIPAFVW